MPETLAPLILDLLEWLAASPRSYPEVMDAWRTSCPRLTVWEDAVDAGLVRCTQEGKALAVELTSLGRRTLGENGRAAAEGSGQRVLEIGECSRDSRHW